MRFVRALLITALGACSMGGGGGDGQAFPGTTARCEAWIGAWEGMQLSGHDAGESFCAVLCENGRLFTGDSACSQTDRGDFAHYYPWTCGTPIIIQGTQVELDRDGNTLSLAVDGELFFHGTPVPEPGLCEDPARTAREPEPDAGSAAPICTDGAKSLPSQPGDPCPQTGTQCATVGGTAVACCVGGDWERIAMSGTVQCQCDQPGAGAVTCAAGGQQACGNGAIDSGEDCDGARLGSATCGSLGMGAGTLRCSSGCRYDASGCGTNLRDGGAALCTEGEKGTDRCPQTGTMCAAVGGTAVVCCVDAQWEIDPLTQTAKCQCETPGAPVTCPGQ